MQALSGLTYYHVDVFSAQALAGNGLTVFLPSQELPSALMLRLTQEMRQFESIFIIAADRPATFAARIFTIEEELDFAGHPILGTAGLLHYLHAPQVDAANWQLQLGARTVHVSTLRRDGCFAATMNQGVPSFGTPLTREQSLPFLAALGIAAEQLPAACPLQRVSTGLPYLIVPIIDGLERVRIVHPAFETLLATVGAKFAYIIDVATGEGRTWDNAGLIEDIATGSAAGPVAAYLIRHGIAAAHLPVTIKQGRFTGRPSHITVRAGDASAAAEMLVSGDVHILARGQFL